MHGGIKGGDYASIHGDLDVNRRRIQERHIIELNKRIQRQIDLFSDLVV